MYIFWRRIVGPTMFFDNSTRQICDVRVHRTNTPLHALVTLNDTTYVEAARVFAERLLMEKNTDEERLSYAFLKAVSRNISHDEKVLLLARLDLLRKIYALEKTDAQKLLTVGEFKNNTQLDPVDHASWTVICQLILNLDETLTKE
jgi:hypothetical protein